MKTYERTHTWISFQIDLKTAAPDFWLLLGEAVSKCDHLSRVPLRPSTARLLHQQYLAKGVAATTAIEGNTLSEAEVLKAVEGKLEVPPSMEYLKQEVDNIIAACNSISDALAGSKLGAVTPQLLARYNKQVLSGLPEKADVVPGKLRDHSVVVGRVYRGAPAEDCEYLLGRLCDWLSGPSFAPPQSQAAIYAIIKAILAHLYVAWIHPFGDGNGRTARLIEFHILLAAGIPSPAAHLLSNHYNQTRTEYYRQLDYSSKSGGDVLPFLMYAVQGFVDGLRAQIDFVWAQQLDVVWRNYVHELFKGRTTAGDLRQRDLALDLGKKRDWVPLSDIALLTPRLAQAYATKTPKTLQRDLKVLEDLDLILRETRRVRAHREVINAFLPLKRVGR